jgi:hypothetical protein
MVNIHSFQLNTCSYSTLTRGWVCCLQVLLALASAVILRSKPRGTRDQILLSQIRDSPNLEGQVPYLCPPGTGWPSCSPRHSVPLSSPPTTHRTMVEVFEPASTRFLILAKSEAKLLHHWQFTANQFVLASSPLRLTTIEFFFQLNPCGNSPYVTSSDEKMGLSLMNMLGLSSSKHSALTAFY